MAAWLRLSKLGGLVQGLWGLFKVFLLLTTDARCAWVLLEFRTGSLVYVALSAINSFDLHWQWLSMRRLILLLTVIKCHVTHFHRGFLQ